MNTALDTKPTGVRGWHIGASDMERMRAFYERIGAEFGSLTSDGIVDATLLGVRLIFEPQPAEWRNPHGYGPSLILEVADPDALHAELDRAGESVEAMENSPWGRMFKANDPEGNLYAFVGPRS